MWVGMRAVDLDVVDLIGSVVHPGLSERREVFGERFALYPLGCMVLLSKLSGFPDNPNIIGTLGP